MIFKIRYVHPDTSMVWTTERHSVAGLALWLIFCWRRQSKVTITWEKK